MSKIIFISKGHHAIQLNKTLWFYFCTPLSHPASSYIKRKKKGKQTEHHQHSNNPKGSKIKLSLKVWEGLVGGEKKKAALFSPQFYVNLPFHCS